MHNHIIDIIQTHHDKSYLSALISQSNTKFSSPTHSFSAAKQGNFTRQQTLEFK